MDTHQGNIGRDIPLDFVKGILVIVMVIYHIMNYFSTASPDDFGYVRFVSGSFIFISGYIVSTFYEKRYKIDRYGISGRLLVRGVKLLTIFTALNLIINLTGFGNPHKAPLGLQQFLSHLSAIYASGSGKFAAFQILLPISYLLMVSPAFLFFNGSKKPLIITTVMIAFSLSFLNIESDNLGLGIVGLLGLSVGMAINGLGHPLFIRSKVIIFFCLLICISLIGYLGRNIMTYSLSILIVLKLFYDLATTINMNRRISQVIILFGKYTLLCYIMQIIFLQGMSWMLSRQRWGLGYETISIFIVTNLYLLCLCSSLSVLRERYEPMDKAYRFVF